MNRKQIIGAIVAAVLFIIIGVASVLTNSVSKRMLSESTMAETVNLLTGGFSVSLPTTPYIAVVEVKGVIQEQTDTTSAFAATAGYQHDTTLEYINMLIADPNNMAILLYVDSPGGAVYESEELYQKLEEYKEVTGRPLWNYMAHYAASGGYYVATPSDYIVANPNTTTGSIGVIISSYDLTGLYEKLGIEEIVIASGDNKAQVFNDDQIEVYQSIVDESYERFVEIVAKGRNLSDARVRELADGRIFSALQAQEVDLIDDIALYPDFQRMMTQEIGVDEFYTLPTSTNVWQDFFGTVQGMVPKSESQVLEGLMDKMESGVPMYYAEQLQ